MKVYVVTALYEEDSPFDQTEVVGVYTTEAKAREAQEAVYNRPEEPDSNYKLLDVALDVMYLDEDIDDA